jgi:uncharacterized protein YukE
MATTSRTEFKMTPSLKRAIVEVVDARIREAHVTKEDFSELKGLVGELAQAQKELAQAQKRTEQAVETLTRGIDELRQEMTEGRQEMTGMRQEMTGVRQEVGGLSRSVGYALENEAYRALPAFLARAHGLQVTERFVRTEIEGEEINFLAQATRADGTPVLIVGESKARLDERRRAEQVLEGLARKHVGCGGMGGHNFPPITSFLNKGKEMILVLPNCMASPKSRSPVIRKSASDARLQAKNLASLRSRGKFTSISTSIFVVRRSNIENQRWRISRGKSNFLRWRTSLYSAKMSSETIQAMLE